MKCESCRPVLHPLAAQDSGRGPGDGAPPAGARRGPKNRDYDANSMSAGGSRSQSYGDAMPASSSNYAHKRRNSWPEGPAPWGCKTKGGQPHVIFVIRPTAGRGPPDASDNDNQPRRPIQQQHFSSPPNKDSIAAREERECPPSVRSEREERGPWLDHMLEELAAADTPLSCAELAFWRQLNLCRVIPVDWASTSGPQCMSSQSSAGFRGNGRFHDDL